MQQSGDYSFPVKEAHKLLLNQMTVILLRGVPILQGWSLVSTEITLAENNQRSKTMLSG
jgi:hypothetical protein